MILAPKGNSGKLGRQIAEDLHIKLAVLTDSESSCSSDGEFALDSGGEETTTETQEGLRQLIRQLLAILQGLTSQLEAMYKYLSPIKKSKKLARKIADVLHINAEVFNELHISDGEFTTTETNEGLEHITRRLLSIVQATTKHLGVVTDDLKKKQHC